MTRALQIPLAHLVIDDRVVFAGDDALFLDGGAIGLDGFTRAAIDCVMRGDSELQTFCASMSALLPPMTSHRVAALVLDACSQPHSVLRVVPTEPLGNPDVIILDFGNTSCFSVAELSAGIRDRLHLKSVVLGGFGHGKGKGSPRLQWFAESSERSLSEFVQLVRSLIRFHSDAVCVLCSSVDRTLVGDLVPLLHTLIVLEPQWPARSTGQLVDFQPSTDDSIYVLRDLMYALRTCDPRDYIGALRPEASSACGKLELSALRNADVVAFTCADQPGALRALGRTRANDVPLSFSRPSSFKTQGNGEPLGQSAVLVIADPEGDSAALAAMAQGLLPTLAAVFDVVLAAGNNWYAVEIEPSAIELDPIHGAEPVLEAFHAALCVADMTRYMRMPLECMARDVPTFVVSTSNTHPLMKVFPEGQVILGVSPSTIVDRLRALDDPSHLSAVIEEQRAAAHRTDLVNIIAGLVDSK